jgi:hypothetical protein
MEWWMYEHATIFLRMANTALARDEIPTDFEPQAVADMLRITVGCPAWPGPTRRSERDL